MDRARNPALDRLDAFIGEWNAEASFEAPAAVVGRTVFEWILDGQFVLQRAEVPHPDAPDCVAIIAFDPAAEAYAQHYFDSRGVVRLYEMSFSDGIWKLSRDSPGFSQRFAGTFSDDGNTIRGAWEKSRDGSTWEQDFDLIYTKVAS